MTPTLGDPPYIEFRDACKKCGAVAGFTWTYGENDGKSKGCATIRCKTRFTLHSHLPNS